ncbi:MAG: ABC transporter permease [Alphaproteobacteria bacterium]
MASQQVSWDRPTEIVVIKPRKGLSPLDLDELWRFRDLLLAFAEREIKLRYRQTLLGAGWVVLQPLLSAGIFSLVFGIIAKMPSSGVPYFLISFSGTLGWTLFNASFSRISPSLIGNAPLIRKVFFPRLIAPLAAIPCVLLDFAVSLVLMILLLIIFRIMPNWGVLLFPVCALAILSLSLGLGLVAASLSARYRDIQHITPFFIQILMYASPVGYSVSAVPPGLKAFYLLNPLAAPIEVIRWSLLGVGTPDFGHLIYSLIVSLACLWGGLVVFRVMERELADVI